MAQVTINSFITNNGSPATAIKENDSSYPRVRIWSVVGGVYNLIIGEPNGSQQSTDGTMDEVTDGSSEDGFYSYVFDDTLGYDPSTTYLVRVDAGLSVTQSERYQVASLTPEQTEEGIADSVWQASSSDYLDVNQMGGRANSTFNNTGQLLLDVSDVETIVQLILKYDTNRTKINTSTSELIVYDDDCQTELRRFKLLDDGGQPSVTDVIERRPISATDGKSVCT